MEDQINKLLNKINDLSNKYRNKNYGDSACAFINLEDINDVTLFDVEEIDLNTLIVNFHNWETVDDDNIDEGDYISVFPQVKIIYIT